MWSGIILRDLHSQFKKHPMAREPGSLLIISNAPCYVLNSTTKDKLIIKTQNINERRRIQPEKHFVNIDVLRKQRPLQGSG